MTQVESGVYAINVDTLVNLLTKAYVSLIKQEIPFKNFPSSMLWGPPGVGKSQAIKQVAKQIENQTAKKVVITDVRLLLFNPVDLRGIPTANADKTLAVWLKPQIFQMNENSDTVNILFLDEISAAPPSVQAAAYQIVLDRMVGEHRLPENCIVIAAGNRATDKSVAFNMPKALANRFCHFEIKGDGAAWHDWAIKQRIHPLILGYVEYNSAALMKFDPSGTSLAFPTPRSWEMLSNVLTYVVTDVNELYPMIIGCIGHDDAASFKAWKELWDSLPKIEAFLKNKVEKLPKTNELQIALRIKLLDFVRTKATKAVVDSAIELSCKMPWGFRIKFLHDLSVIKELEPLLLQNEVYNTAVENGFQ